MSNSDENTTDLDQPSATLRGRLTRRLTGLSDWLNRRPTTVRWVLAGPVVLIVSRSSMAAIPFWCPKGAAGVDHLVFPVILFPIIWSAFFFYAVMSDRLLTTSAVLVGAIGGQLALILVMI
ncbi:MAG: hypothetical protein AAGF19_07480 [Pseudomonadota bacterium]